MRQTVECFRPSAARWAGTVVPHSQRGRPHDVPAAEGRVLRPQPELRRVYRPETWPNGTNAEAGKTSGTMGVDDPRALPRQQLDAPTTQADTDSRRCPAAVRTKGHRDGCPEVHRPPRLDSREERAGDRSTPTGAAAGRWHSQADPARLPPTMYPLRTTRGRVLANAASAEAQWRAIGRSKRRSSTLKSSSLSDNS
jgi:hypothetical protein